MSVLSKLAMGLGGAGVVGTGCYFVVSNFSSPEKIKEKLSSRLAREGFDLLNFDSETSVSQNWKDILVEYKKQGEATSEKFPFSLAASGTDEEKKNVDFLKEACRILVDSEDESNDAYIKARRWCVVPKTVKEILGKLNKRNLKYENNESEDNDVWKSKIGKYDHSKLPLSGITWPGSGDDQKVSELKKGCKTLLEKTTKTYSKDFTTEYETAVSWCLH
ncbi:hypothetical protein MHC_01750 [Mycoplasma haemocanis str. Illinois]|uniref:Lipoprotein n=1 Tax=Mycoplasma haemocanis (strain Illinois) TaxID=1111676 RepID=H6N6E4_MYCHN|nr:hypothetical protein [Mycoplasma haemocanis]AEW45216.1 hypothetical protein MHC_01750 [Mycoplasma haemocanis str. Illinois]